jgi:hypothetical protein
MTAAPRWSITTSPNCPNVNGHGYQCMICPAAAVGHSVVVGGPHDGRCLAVTCARHSSAAGWEEVKGALAVWFAAGLLSLADGGPGPDGAPEVWHGDHFDPMPAHKHGETP